MSEEKKELAELIQSHIGESGLQAWLDELASLAQVFEVLTKGGECVHSEKAPLTLADAVAALRAGQTRGVQVRYLLLEVEWLDTLLCAPAGGYRLVRLKAQGGKLQG